ncbi:ribonuclease HII [Alicyclobacillus contaminans]|uniref:ribonuclease HII n=1 Tax=Alicyclobacillus contaminans TaxID=392016 RepID=UPI001FE0F129|nr:ribonuclease HII [Alicyclobacillus contaminans]
MAKGNGHGALKASPMEKVHSMWRFERALAGTAEHLAGVDEAGRGALAGPVVAAAVVLGQAPDAFVGVDDSKKLSRAKREALYDIICRNARAVSIGIASSEEIDASNILQASRLAMARAMEALETTVSLVLVDGPYAPLYGDRTWPSIPVVDGDAKCLSIAAASVVAKVYRDRLMAELAESYPEYGFDQNAGYGTPVHLAALQKFGPAACHRKSFAPVQRHLQARLW